MRKAWTLPLALLTTRPHDFLANDYYGVSPFRSRVEAPGEPPLLLRLVPEFRPLGWPGDRWARLDRAVELGLASLRLEARRGHGPWRPLVRVVLERRVELDQDQLSFEPWRAGRGLEPTGFVQALRPAAYLLGQVARGARS